jgi:uncharacterized protein (TIGR03083 family)
MAETTSPRQTVAALGAAARQEAAALAGHTRGLDAAGWNAPTWCPGWSVREIVAHLAEGMDRFGQQVRGALAGQPVEFSMEERTARRAQVKALPDDELLARLEGNTAAFFEHAQSLADADLTRAIVPMAAGLTPIVQVAHLRLYEPALHRWDVLQPTDPSATLDAHAATLLLDYALATAPRQASRDVLGDARGVARCEVSGSAGGPVTLTWADGAVQAARGAPHRADVTLHLTEEALVRLLSGRLPLATLEQGTTRVEGDRAAAVLLARAFGSH